MKARRTIVAALALGLLPLAPAYAGPVDPLREVQWGLALIQSPQAWARSVGKGVVVAVIDTGVDPSHPDLRGQLVKGYNAIDPKKSTADDHGHGTHVAGIIAAKTNNGVGIASVAPGARIMPVKVLDANGRGTLQDVVEGMRWAADNGAKVLNLSLGFQSVLGNVLEEAGLLAGLAEAADYAWKKGAIVVAAAGNDGVPLCSEPAALATVVCVGSVDRRGIRTYYSNNDAVTGTQFICAPGGSGLPLPSDREDILSTVPPGAFYDYDKTGYSPAAGTSMAAPHVSGVMALLLARRMNNKRAVDTAMATAVRMQNGEADDPICGAGRVDALRAVQAS